ncbi:30S ribosomal protein S6e [Candidatus Woesearchaeota archaeon]|nr:30S ribosomal protein S6e [Candidatus Woesearchaeota archaeon]
MAEFKFVINDTKTGKTYQRALEDETLVGKRIGETVPGDFLGLEGYELQIRGGSDFAGFPLRKDIDGPVRKKGLFGPGVGVKVDRKGMKLRKTVCGNTITVKTVQVNLCVKKYGEKALDELLGKAEAKAE